MMKIKGVHYNERTGKWQSRIMRDSYMHHIGTFNTEDEANKATLDFIADYHRQQAKAADRAARRYGNARATA